MEPVRPPEGVTVRALVAVPQLAAMRHGPEKEAGGSPVLVRAAKTVLLVGSETSTQVPERLAGIPAVEVLA